MPSRIGSSSNTVPADRSLISPSSCSRDRPAAYPVARRVALSWAALRSASITDCEIARPKLMAAVTENAPASTPDNRVNTDSSPPNWREILSAMF